MTLVATQVKRRRGTTAENDAFTGAEGEIVVDTERHELRVHDGTTQGGFVIPTTETMDFASKSLDNLSENGEARFANKANSDLSNTPSNIDYVIESQEPTTANGYTWYRKYKSGWVEQGGNFTYTARQSVYTTIVLPIQMANNHYTLVSEPGYTARSDTATGQHVASRNGLKTTTTIFIAAFGNGTDDLTDYIDWQVSGMAAQ